LGILLCPLLPVNEALLPCHFLKVINGYPLPQKHGRDESLTWKYFED
jgi:hypothetical protein